MKRFHGFVSGLSAVLLAVFIVACGSDGGENAGGEGGSNAQAEGSNAAGGADAGNLVEKGKTLVTVLGCNDCHTVKKMGPEGMPMLDESMLLAGHPASMTLPEHDPALVAPGQWILANQSFTAYVGPWGTSYAANLTPDPTGLGGWTEAQFAKAMREGWLKGTEGTRKLLPPMPWQGYQHLTDDELKAIFAYLQSVPAVENAVSAPVPPAGMPPQADAEHGAEGASSGA